jgi:hypothetical protein
MTHATAERRSGERFRTHLEGRIVLDDSSSFVECITWEISATGARIGFREPVEIPLEFELQIPEEDACAKVRLVWSNGKEYGVMFTD